MCGRLVCALSPEQICNSCCYKNSGDIHYVTPQWKDTFNSGKKYEPSYNVCPNEVAPVLLSGGHFKENSRLVSPMVFGVIPQWKNTMKKYNTINCKIETVMTSKLYGVLLKKGQRCVVICNGFYEWNKSKKPYFFFDEQGDGIVIDSPDTWNLNFTPDNGYSGFKPLKLAALFNKNSDSVRIALPFACSAPSAIKNTKMLEIELQLEEATLSFTIITKEAGSQTSGIHSREPAILKTDEQLDAWLNYEEVDAELALKYISTGGTLLFHPVSIAVNKPINKDISCIKEEKKMVKSGKSSGSAQFLKSWLETGQKRKGSPVTEETNEKIKKTEE